MPMHSVLFLCNTNCLIYMTKICIIYLQYLYKYKIIKIIFERIEVFYQL